MAQRKLTAEQKRWRAENDAYILAQARVVESDVERFNAATKVAQQKANNLKKEAAAMQKVANSKRKNNIMENSNGTKEKVGREQRFYFNEDGKLVVESNKGVWVDGEQFVKMYGDFVCNAKTLGFIIEKFKGFRVLVAKFLDDRYVAEIVNPSDIEKSYNNEVSYLQEQIDKNNERIYDLKKSIENFNRLPWWKRIFKKVEI